MARRMKIAEKISTIFDKTGYNKDEISSRLGVDEQIMWNMRSRGIANLKDLVNAARVGGYKTYMYNKEANIKIEITPEDLNAD